MTIYRHGEAEPRISEKAYIFPGCHIIGRVSIEAGVNIWYNCVIRGDINSISIGSGTNIQDGCIIHVDHDFPTLIGSDVTVGHGVIVHGSKLADRCLIGMGATLLNGSEIGEGAIVAAGALVREGYIVPERTLVAGVPARVVREVSDEEYRQILNSSVHYRENAAVQHGS